MRACTCLIEPLDSRQLYAGQPTFDVQLLEDGSRTVAVTGTGGRDIVSVHFSPNAAINSFLTGRVEIRFNPPANGKTEVRRYSRVSSFLFQGGTGNDVVVLSGIGFSRTPLTIVPQIDGGSGNDSLNYVGCDITALISGEGGNDTITAVHGFSATSAVHLGEYSERYLSGGSGNDTITGSFGPDQISGDDGNDVLAGRRGDDRIEGRTGSDSLFGEGGNDTLEGGEGTNYLYGGSGNDTFIDKPREGLGASVPFGVGGYNDYFAGESGSNTVIRYTNPNVLGQTFSSTWVNIATFIVIDVTTEQML